MKNYSTEVTGILVMLISPLVGNYLSDACAGEVSELVATTLVAVAAGIFLWVKRYQRGGITPLGVKK